MTDDTLKQLATWNKRIAELLRLIQSYPGSAARKGWEAEIRGLICAAVDSMWLETEPEKQP